MATGRDVIPTTEQPVIRRQILRVGPFTAALNTQVDQPIISVPAGRSLVVESVELTGEAAPESACTVRLVNQDAGQALAAAVSASQYISSAMNAESIADGTPVVGTISNAYNVIEAGGTLSVKWSSENVTGIANAVLTVVVSEIVG